MKNQIKWITIILCVCVGILIGCTPPEYIAPEEYEPLVEYDDKLVADEEVEEIKEYIAEPMVKFMSSAVGGNFPVFTTKNSTDWTQILLPQYITVLQEKGNWFEVEFGDESGWVDIEFTPSLTEIEQIFESFGDYTSFYFYNIKTSFRHAFNGDHVFYGASTPKVFYAHFLYYQDETGVITLTDLERTWIAYTLRTSLDEFSLNLEAQYGIQDYHNWLDEQGIELLHSNAFNHYGLSTRYTVNEAILLMQGIYKYLLTGTPNAIEFRYHMINNEARFIVSENYHVASKTGWLIPQHVRHDVAIIEAPSPYILTISIHGQHLAENEFYYFRLFSQLFEEFNNKWFGVGIDE